MEINDKNNNFMKKYRVDVRQDYRVCLKEQVGFKIFIRSADGR